MIRVVIAGTRTFNDFDLLCTECDRILGSLGPLEIISGGAQGADALGEKYAKLRGHNFESFPPDWVGKGRYAPFTRNKEMAEISQILIAFWDGKSTGTKNMIKYAKSNGLEIHTINIKKKEG